MLCESLLSLSSAVELKKNDERKISARFLFLPFVVSRFFLQGYSPRMKLSTHLHATVSTTIISRCIVRLGFSKATEPTKPVPTF